MQFLRLQYMYVCTYMLVQEIKQPSLHRGLEAHPKQILSEVRLQSPAGRFQPAAFVSTFVFKFRFLPLT